MFGGFVDEVEYEKRVGEDTFGNIRYAPALTVEASYVKGPNTLNIGGDIVTVKSNKCYHVSIEVFEGDKIDGRIVTSVYPARNIHGKVYFWIVQVE